jgi:arabinofuranan 3-O-arabinosyltransferase
LRGSAALDGDPKTSWTPAGTTGEWLSIELPQHSIDHLAIDTVIDPNHTSILQLRATFSDGSTAIGQLSEPAEGKITMTFQPRSVSSVTLSIEKVFAAGSARPRPVSIEEVHIPDVLPIEASADALLSCSIGPGFSIDHVFIPVKPGGSVGNLLDGRAIPLRTCGDRPVLLGAGMHDLAARGALQPDVLSLGTPGFGHHVPAQAPLPALDFTARSDGGIDVRVRDAHGPYYLVIGQNFDEGWQAHAGGVDLGPPLLLDGYSAGWRIDRSGSYVVAVRFRPQRTYTFAVLTTGVAAVVACLIVVADLMRRRRRNGEAERRA